MTTAVGHQTDEVIQREVLLELKWDAQIAPNEIGVAVKNGVVTLTGYVDSFSKKWAAERAALRVRGVKGVANEIEVRLSPADQSTDSEIAEAAARALALDSTVPEDAIKVTVSRGWVTLQGEVEWEYQRREAERVVRNLRGVRGVSNLVALRPRTGPSPDELRKKIEDALVRTAETDAENITVATEGSKVILSGTVRSWAERREAERVAWLAPGVTEVENRIRLQP
ncbi:BON domain-containing protein [Actinoplanes sp. KI2]|uniref:BON domain-containing protein n=1 Tax=Actinoplanes sp. KI2 TaxID=2983315 RepID=UPI0021D5A1AC|nr:BON domain-containing protein [Actinoplanes sp. KI2]MCU7730809.1 BON domain-containing protein [Actinoplanes sp. KI2]